MLKERAAQAGGGNHCTEMKSKKSQPAGNYDFRGARKWPHNEATKWKITENINHNPQGPLPCRIYPPLVEPGPNLARIIKLMLYFSTKKKNNSNNKSPILSK